MPNHISTNFRVTGPTAEVKRFIKDAAGKDSVLSLDSLIPMPSELLMVSSPVRIMTQEEIDKQWADWNKKKDDGTLSTHEKDRPWGIGITRETSDSYKAKYGADNWYDWAIRNWGSKWNAYDVTEWSINECSEYTASATIYYETAWSPATALWLNVSKEYPTLEFYHEFADEGGAFLGSETIVDGRFISEEELDWDSDDGIELREGLGRYWPEDAEDEVEA